MLRRARLLNSDGIGKQPYPDGMPTLYFDESGYSGADLLEKKTPYYAASALNLTEARAQELKRLHFPDKQAELKFSELKSGRNFYRARDLMQTLLRENAVRVTVLDKRFVLTAKIFEWVAEPSLAGRADLYGEGQLPKLVSAFHREAARAQPNVLQLVHSSFMRAMNEQDAQAFAAFITHLQALTGEVGDIARDLLIPPARREGLGLVSDLSITEGPLGILLSAAWQNLLRWGNVIPAGRPIEVIYDQHSVMEAEASLWNTMTAAALDMTANGLGYTLDHPVTTTLGDSKTYTALQLADVAAGFASLAVQFALRQNAGQPQQSNLPQPGRIALELLRDASFAEQQVLVTIHAGTDGHFTGWTFNGR